MISYEINLFWTVLGPKRKFIFVPYSSCEKIEKNTDYIGRVWMLKMNRINTGTNKLIQMLHCVPDQYLPE